MEGRFFTSTEAAEITRCSRRQLQYWREKGIVSPTVDTTGKGRNVYYSIPDLLALTVMEYLLTIGLSFEVCRKALDLLRSKEAWFFDQMIEQTPMKWLMFLPTDTKEPGLDVAKFDQHAALEALCQGRPVVPFKTDWVRSRLHENLKNFRQSSSIQRSSA
ncbi:MAG: MerR family transcriptional regulator [Stenomitos frigidus ULC029]